MRARTESLSNDQARRIALAAQGFADPRPAGRVDRRHLHRVVGRTGLLQLDSVNVVVRSHFLPLYSRLGPYPRSLLESTAWDRGELWEYWGHEASLMPPSLHPLLRWRMHRADAWGGMKAVAAQHPEYVEDVFAQVASNGPITAGQLTDPGARREGWGWGWSLGKRALEWLFWTGRIAVTRGPNFQRRYDLPERVLPLEVLAAPTPPEADAHRELLALAGRALGVATVADLADYYRLTVPLARPRVRELADEGRLLPVAVEGWPQPAYLHPEARLPRRVPATALLSPFDSLLWERGRVERLFGFRYRIEIYTPGPKRVFGYYVLPFLMDGDLVARVDLKADRTAQVLRVQAAFFEPTREAARVAERLRPELETMAAWLGLDDVAVARRGDLASALAGRLRRRR